MSLFFYCCRNYSAAGVGGWNQPHRDSKDDAQPWHHDRRRHRHRTGTLTTFYFSFSFPWVHAQQKVWQTFNTGGETTLESPKRWLALTFAEVERSKETSWAAPTPTHTRLLAIHENDEVYWSQHTHQRSQCVMWESLHYIYMYLYFLES